LATVIRGADIDRDPLLLAAALERARADAVAPETEVAPAAADDPVVGNDQASLHGELDAFDAPTEEESAAPDPAALLEQIEARRAEIFEQAYQEGYEAGEQAGQQQARQARDEEIAALLEIAASMRSAFDGYLSDAEDVLVEIAFASVCKILGRALCERAGVSAMVQELIEQVREREQLVVRLAPADYALLAEPHAQASRSDAWNVQLKPDARVSLGGCLIDSPSGTLDGRLETQLERLREVLVATRAMNADGAS
jgi:flagellar assembly protein FliH